jgi:hypothetical protein
MTLSELYKQVPEYYDWMYLDGYTPEEIMNAKRKQMYNDYIARKKEQEAEANAEPEYIIPNMTFRSVVTVK